MWENSARLIIHSNTSPLMRGVIFSGGTALARCYITNHLTAYKKSPAHH
jgi:predicted nucleotidyltransferase component of viral defense system